MTGALLRLEVCRAAREWPGAAALGVLSVLFTLVAQQTILEAALLAVALAVALAASGEPHDKGGAWLGHLPVNARAVWLSRALPRLAVGGAVTLAAVLAGVFREGSRAAFPLTGFWGAVLLSLLIQTWRTDSVATPKWLRRESGVLPLIVYLMTLKSPKIEPVAASLDMILPAALVLSAVSAAMYLWLRLPPAFQAVKDDADSQVTVRALRFAYSAAMFGMWPSQAVPEGYSWAKHTTETALAPHLPESPRRRFARIAAPCAPACLVASLLSYWWSGDASRSLAGFGLFWIAWAFSMTDGDHRLRSALAIGGGGVFIAGLLINDPAEMAMLGGSAALAAYMAAQEAYVRR